VISARAGVLADFNALHQTLKTGLHRNHHYLPRELEAKIAAFMRDYNQWRPHESLNYLTQADVYLGRDQAILDKTRG
jgi:putative transposase